MQTILRGRIFENIHGIEVGIAKIRGKPSGCIKCEECRLKWYLLSAINLGDPYKIVEINKLLSKRGVNVLSGVRFDAYIRESMAWIGLGNFEDGTSEETSAADLIHRWKLRLLTPADLEVLRTASTKFPWMLEIMRASVFEMKGDTDTAVQDYRRALRIMPNWLPEAQIVHEKINELGHRAI